MDALGERFIMEQKARYGAPVTEMIEAGRVRDYLLALDKDACHDRSAPVPPLFLLTLGRSRRPHLNRLPGGTVNASDEFEFFKDAFVGDEITIETIVVGVEKKVSAARDLYLISLEKLYRNKAGEVIARRFNRILRWE